MTRLQELELELLSLAGRVNLKPTLAAAWDAGRVLTSARALVPHGEWRSWLARVNLSKSSAGEYMAVFANTEKPNVRSGGQIGIRQFVKTVRSARRQSIEAERIAALAALPEVGQSEGLIHGDSLAWLKSRPTASVPFIVTDPPFGLGLTYDGFSDPASASDYIQWFMPFWTEMQRVLVPGGSLVVCQALRYLRHFWDWFGSDICIASASTTIRSMVVWYPVVRWNKPGDVPLIHREGNSAIIGNSTQLGQEKYLSAHPCPKAVWDCRQLIDHFTLPDSLVVDPFMGVGGFGVACGELGRRYIGIEQSEKYYRLACQRLTPTAMT